MRYKKDIPRKFRNGFREENVYKKALPAKESKKELTYAKIPRRKHLKLKQEKKWMMQQKEKQLMTKQMNLKN